MVRNGIHHIDVLLILFAGVVKPDGVGDLLTLLNNSSVCRIRCLKCCESILDENRCHIVFRLGRGIVCLGFGDVNDLLSGQGLVLKKDIVSYGKGFFVV